MIEIYHSEASFRENDFEYVWSGQSERCWRVRFNHQVEQRTREAMEEGGKPTTETVYTCDYMDYYAPFSYVPSSALELIKDIVTANIHEYDNSDNVNGFILNGNNVWLNKDTRVGLMNSTTIQKAAGAIKADLWFGNMNLSIECDTIIALLSQLELYALECYNKTAEHLKNVSLLTSVDEVAAYDFRAGYPSKLEIAV